MWGSRNQDPRLHPLRRVAKKLRLWIYILYKNPRNMSDLHLTIPPSQSLVVLRRWNSLLSCPCSSSLRRSQSLQLHITTLAAPPEIYPISSPFLEASVGRHSPEHKVHSAWAIRPFARRRSPTDAPSHTRTHLMGLNHSRHTTLKARTSPASTLVAACRSTPLVPRASISPQRRRHSSVILFTFPRALTS